MFFNDEMRAAHDIYLGDDHRQRILIFVNAPVFYQFPSKLWVVNNPDRTDHRAANSKRA